MLDHTTQPFPLFEPTRALRDLKDPCPVFDGAGWHLFGSGGSVITETWLVYHATATSLEGPWTEQPPIDLGLKGSGVAAPGVVFADGLFRMFIQTEFMKAGGTIEYLTSPDGFAWTRGETALRSILGTSEHGIYDPHPAMIGGACYLAYSGMPAGWPPKPDVYLARSASGTWDGPWVRLGAILDHEAIANHHNQHGSANYEWGIEGAQLIELPAGMVLLNATSFLPKGVRGSRQRVFFAVAKDVLGPYESLGPVLQPAGAGENGHATVLLDRDRLILCYQARVESTGHRWRYGLAKFQVGQLALHRPRNEERRAEPICIHSRPSLPPSTASVAPVMKVASSDPR